MQLCSKTIVGIPVQCLQSKGFSHTLQWWQKHTNPSTKDIREPNLSAAARMCPCRDELKAAELSRKSKRWGKPGCQSRVPRTLCGHVMPQGWVVLLLGTNGNRAPLSDRSVVQARNITQQSMFPNKSLLLSAHNHPNNIYFMACRWKLGVSLLGDFAKTFLWYKTDRNLLSCHLVRKKKACPRLKKNYI